VRVAITQIRAALPIRTAEKIPLTRMLSKINDGFRINNNKSIILSGHGFASFLAVLRALGFEFQENQVVAKLVTYLLGCGSQMEMYGTA
jgi:hypothetical protein